MPILSRRGALGLAAASLPPRVAQAAWPDRPIRILHGFAPGGTADTLSRLMAAPLSEALGQPVVVEARPGAGGNIATAALARAASDGDTLDLLTGGHAVNAAFGQALPYDPVADFDFIALILRYAFVVVVRQDSTARDLAGLLAMARARPGEVSFGSAGTGSSTTWWGRC
jgi:tripartite-type tricarboxylate transporter receptor subunit TctC